MSTTDQLPEPELGYIKTDKSNQPAFSARQMREAMKPTTTAPVGEIKWAANVPNSIKEAVFYDLMPPIGTKLYTASQSTKVQGEPVAWCIEAQVDDEWFVQYPIAFTKQGAELDASSYTPGTVLRIRPLAFGDTTTQAAQATQAQMTDVEIEVLFGKCGGHWNGDQWVIEDADFHPFARTILALHPERVPMTDLPEGDVTYFDGRGDAVDGYTAERVWEILRSHGITAQAKEETP